MNSRVGGQAPLGAVGSPALLYLGTPVFALVRIMSVALSALVETLAQPGKRGPRILFDDVAMGHDDALKIL